MFDNLVGLVIVNITAVFFFILIAVFLIAARSFGILKDSAAYAGIIVLDFTQGRKGLSFWDCILMV